MDFCRNVSVSAGLPSDLPSEQVISPAYPTLGALSTSLDDLFPCENTEDDVSLEWLSIFVEDCLSSNGNCIPVPTSTQGQESQTIRPLKPSKKNHGNPCLGEFFIPGKARSKRKRSRATPLIGWFQKDPQNHLLHAATSDPPLLHQAYWLADSELILPKKEKSSRNEEEEEEEDEEGEEKPEEKMVGKDSRGSSGNLVEASVGQQPRRCTHCLSQKTPQWRAGPLGPKTLCNACGVRFKSGRLLPEYRPAKSPTFVSDKHSNSHKKIMEMRMAMLSSVSTE